MGAFGTVATTILVASFASCAIVQHAEAQSYPARSITLIVPFAPGGIADVVGRLVGHKLSERLGQSVIVENRVGGAGNLGPRAVANATPDGYTLLSTTTATAIAETAFSNRGYDTSDLRAIAIVAISPDLLAVPPSNPAKDLKEFVANGRRASFTYATAGVGTAPHIGAEYFFKEVAKVQAIHVPYSGGAPATAAALGKFVDALVLTAPTPTPYVLDGRLRALGVAGEKRIPALKDVPTYREMGFDVVSGSWVGFFAPAKTPDAIALKLNTEINGIMQSPDVLEKLAQIGFDPMIRNVADTEAYFKNEVARWGKMVRAAGVSN